MNIKSMMIASTILIAVAATSLSYAQVRQDGRQDTGFRIGVAPQNGLTGPVSANPVQGMTTPPIQAMTTPPILPMGGGIAAQQAPIVLPQVLLGSGNGAINVLSPGGIIFVPAGTLVIENTPGMDPGAFLSAPNSPSIPANPSVPANPSAGRGGNTSIQRSNRKTNDATQTSPKEDGARLELGTPRDKVIEKYGNPIAFMMNMNGETLYFNGGVVVFVKNGVVASPGN